MSYYNDISDFQRGMIATMVNTPTNAELHNLKQIEMQFFTNVAENIKNGHQKIEDAHKEHSRRFVDRDSGLYSLELKLKEFKKIINYYMDI